jgi:hypothetical protein
MADGDDEAAQVVTEDESARRTREAMENLEVGRLLRGMFAAGATFFQVQFSDGEFTAYQLRERGTDPREHRTASRDYLLDALRAICSPAEVPERRCSKCGQMRPVTEFRRRSPDKTGRSTGAYRGQCNTCRKERDEQLRKVGRRA